MEIIDLKATRKFYKLSQVEMAYLLRMPYSTYCKWEQGVMSPPYYSEVHLCYYLAFKKIVYIPLDRRIYNENA